MLTPPWPDDLKLHMRREEPFSATETEWAEDSLQRATDLMYKATGLDAEPTDEVDARLLQVGILAMAHMLYATGGEDREAMYNPYSSERIGSYSYSKAQASVASGTPTGVPEFDYAVSMFSSANPDMVAISTTSEAVFTQPYSDALEVSRQVELTPDAWNETY